MTGHLKSAPLWVWCIIAGMSLIEPATHLWLMYAAPVGTVHSGMHISDSVTFIHAMRMFDTDFWAAYATCNAGDLGHSPAYFPVPFLWMYGGVGEVGRYLRVDEFLMLGLANAFGAALYLAAVYAFFRTIVPKIADRAFLLFALGGGVGGVAYVASAATGLIENGDFESNFFRIALYELLEGPRMAPWLVFPRLYYTLPLALSYMSFSALHQGLLKGSFLRIVFAVLLAFAAAFLNIRVGPFIWVIAMLLLYCDEETRVRVRVQTAILLTVVVGLAGSMTYTMLQWNTVYAENVFSLNGQGMLVSGFVIAAFFHLFLAPGAIRRTFDTMPNGAYILGCGAVGYAVTYVILYGGYQVYYGSFWPPSDYSASVWGSDWALLGIVVGVIYASVNLKFRVSITDEDTVPMHWITLWFLLFVTAAPSGFGQGWFLGLGPERLMLFMGPPLCILSAKALERAELRRPFFYMSWMTLMIVCGAASITAAALCFQGPLGLRVGESAFDEYHAEVIAEADGRLLDSLGEGMVLTPTSLPRFGDVVTLRGNSALHGLGAADLSSDSASSIVDEFFASGSTEEIRRDIAVTYCAGWVFCPTTPPLPADVLENFRGYDWLEEVDTVDGGAVFRVAL